MKNIFFVLSLLFSLNVYSQEKIVSIPESELEEFFLAIDTLREQDSLKTVLISNLELQLLNKTKLNLSNETILLNLESDIKLLNDKINLYQDRLKITDAWYNKRWFGVVIGVVSTSTAIYLAGQIQ